MDFLFSSFDPSGSLGFFSNWMITSFPLVVIFLTSFWKTANTLSIPFKKVCLALNNEFMPLFKNKGSTLSLSSIVLFILILSFNIFGLFPYIFTPSSHIPTAIALGLPLWIGVQLWSSIYYFNDWLAHLVPSGSPIVLAPFLVIVECISNIIRPLTLSIRLVANMFAGHMILSLAGEGCSMSAILISMLVPLVVLEIGVALIQSFVFSLLTSLYASEFI